MKKSSTLIACLCLSSSFLWTDSLKASVEDIDPQPSTLRKSSKLVNVFSAITAVDSESFNPPELPKSLRGTWEEYNPEFIESFLSGELMMINPSLLDQDLSWDELTEADKEGISAVSVMYDQKKSLMKEKGIITEEELLKSWGDLGQERQKSIPQEWLLPSREGLSESRGIGCGQFNEDQLQEVTKFIIDHDDEVRAQKLHENIELLNYEAAMATVKEMRAAGAIKTPITVIDHREEPHLHLKVQKAVGNSREGLIFNEQEESLPMSLYAPGDAFSHGASNLKAERIEGELIQKVQKHDVVSLSLIMNKNMGLIQDSKTQTYQVNAAYSEKALSEAMGLGYVRVPITDHHAIEGEDGDYLKIAFDSQPSGTYVLHHCRGGRGRTETGLTTRDMMFNRNKGLTFADFVLRHVLIGGPNLLGPLVGVPEKEWKKPQAYERARALHSFYQYTQDEKEGVRTLYRDWLKQRQHSS